MTFKENHFNIFLVGAFPPPVHGMAVVNKAVLDQLRLFGVDPFFLDISSNELSHRIKTRLRRIPKVIIAINCLLLIHKFNDAHLYMSVSGGIGKIYEILIATLARFKGLKLFLHHHSFSYCLKYSLLTHLLIRITGSQSVQIVLSDKMGQCLKDIYKATNLFTVSNAVFCLRDNISISKSLKKLHTIGFISNISAQKGIFLFLDLMTEIKDRDILINAKIAGPFDDYRTKRMVNQRLSELKNVEYVGPKYGREKNDFFEDIDVIVFPTQYENEADPLIVLEAMSHGVPIIAYGRGCIPETVGVDCGKVITPDDAFVPAAMDQIKQWVSKPTTFETASLAALNRFSEISKQANVRWQELLRSLMGHD